MRAERRAPRPRASAENGFEVWAEGRSPPPGKEESRCERSQERSLGGRPERPRPQSPRSAARGASAPESAPSASPAAPPRPAAARAPREPGPALLSAALGWSLHFPGTRTSPRTPSQAPAGPADRRRPELAVAATLKRTLWQTRCHQGHTQA
ncbi:predicted GPI-anchored protein 58 [Sapajus apella]|uniref:Predicted GPI-anchored protein 58 n=1 Tax=Sapajus apella TaxID=9515 RepID=A0A6J3GH48_SAPAP|nr:predicted GPI-anchored protein 58 [Sapajus apella]